MRVFGRVLGLPVDGFPLSEPGATLRMVSVSAHVKCITSEALAHVFVTSVTSVSSFLLALLTVVCRQPVTS